MNRFWALMVVWIIGIISYKVLGFELAVINLLILTIWGQIPDKTDKEDENTRRD